MFGDGVDRCRLLGSTEAPRRNAGQNVPIRLKYPDFFDVVQVFDGLRQRRLGKRCQQLHGWHDVFSIATKRTTLVRVDVAWSMAVSLQGTVRVSHQKCLNASAESPTARTAKQSSASEQPQRLHQARTSRRSSIWMVLPRLFGVTGFSGMAFLKVKNAPSQPGFDA